MRPEDTHPEGCGGESARSVGALIRAAADQELTPEQVAEFERLCAERNCTEDRVKFERTLRESCGRVMTGPPCCMEALRAKIVAMAERTREPGTSDAGGGMGEVGAVGEAEGAERLAPRTRKMDFWRRSPGMAAAAALLLVVAGTLVWQASRLPTAPAPAGMTQQQVSYRDRVAGYVSDEHSRCCRSDAAAQAKLVHRDPAAARDHYAQTFGAGSVAVEADAVQAGQVSFWGGGDCQIPGSPKSAHVRFDAVSPEGEVIRLSLFVMPDTDRLPLKPGTTYRMNAAVCDDAGVALYAWCADGLTYLLVTEAKGEFCTMVRQALHAPAQVAAY